MKWLTLLIMSLFVLTFNLVSAAENPETILNSLNWTHGPGRVEIGSIAHIQLRNGYAAIDGGDAVKLLKSMHNITSGHEISLVAKDDMSYFAVYYFDDVGYVNDDEKKNIDADSLLATIKKNNEITNQKKREKGWDTLEVVGWALPPRYNEATHTLEWAVKFRGDNGFVVNYNTRYLGRHGVMRVILVCDPGSLNNTIRDFKSVMTAFNYNEGNSYAEYVQGDKVAKYGLGALIVGGAAAAAVKSGFGKYIIKIIVGAFAAIAIFAKNIIKKINKN